MERTIALAGNPNCGKTTLFNNLTGATQYVGNWPGVTVEKKEGKLKGHKDVSIIDLPGIYSLSPYTLEEVVTRDYIEQQRPSVIVNMLDASNLERNLYLTTQLLEFDIPVVIALNMMDIVEKRGDTIDMVKLSAELGCPVVTLTAVKGRGQKELVDAALAAVGTSVGSRPIVAAVQAAAGTSNDADEQEENMANARYDVIGEVIARASKRQNIGLTTSDKIDKIVTNRILALPIFVGIMWLVYYVSVSTVGDWITVWTNDVFVGEMILPAVEEFLLGLGTMEWLVDLIVNGALAGVGAVLGFIPQIAVLFIFLSLLEDCGYMARVAFIMDRIFRKFGLSGKSFIPMLISSGCAVPGVMATKTIENEKDRRMTVITTIFIPCGAKLPVIALIAGAIGGEAWVGQATYFLGIASVIVSGIILKKTKMFAGDPAPFIMELPPYHLPSLKGLVAHVWERVSSFAIRAGTVIFISSALIWFLSGYGFGPDGFGGVEMDESLLAGIGNMFTWLFVPIGFGNWQSVVATVSGLIAKENVLAVIAVLFGLAEDIAEDDPELLMNIAVVLPTLWAGLSFLAFNMLCAPCFAAIGAIRKQMNSVKWTMFAVGYQCGFAYIVALMIYQLGTFATGGGFGIGTVAGVICLLGLIYMLVRKNPNEHAAKTGAPLKDGVRT